jgi:hypothetical protein
MLKDHGNLVLASGNTQQYSKAEVYAIKACAVENLNRNYKNRNFYMVLREQADWTLILLLAASCKSAGPIAEENGAAQ